MGKTTLAVLPRRPEPSRRAFGVNRWRRGVLMAPVWIDGRLRGEPGQVVRYRQRDDRLDVVVGVYRLVRDVPGGQVVPYHPELTSSRVYLHLTRCRPENDGQPGDKCLLAINVAREFKEHELREDLVFLACRYAETYEGKGNTRYPRTRMLIREYLRAHPRGRFRDWMEWKSIQLKYHFRNDYDVAKPLSAVQACERFLAVRPYNAYKTEIKLHMARLYHAAYECIAFARREEHKHRLTLLHAERFLKRSEYLYRGLTGSPDMQVRHIARVALYNLTQGEVNRSRW